MSMLNFNIDLNNLVKLFNSGKVDKVYERIYVLAENLAKHEMINYSKELMNKIDAAKMAGRTLDVDTQLQTIHDVYAFREKRMNHHIEEMKNLLLLSIKGSIKNP